jgi:hypothetical protein
MPSLTPREQEVLTWAAQGKSAWEAGEAVIRWPAKPTNLIGHQTASYNFLGMGFRRHLGVALSAGQFLG